MMSVRGKGDPALPAHLPDPGPAVAALQDAAFRALQAVLGGTALPMLPSDGSAALLPWLVEAPVAGPLVRIAGERLTGASVFGLPGAASPLRRALVARALAPRLRAARWRQRLRGLGRALWSRLRRIQPQISPPLAPAGTQAFGPALVAMAFGDVSLRNRIALELRAALSRRVLFHPGGLPLIHLADQTLLALTLAGTPSHSGPVANAAWQILAVLSSRPGWAGFWDQWVLVELARTTPAALPPGIARLPLLRDRGTLRAEAPEDPPEVQANWRSATLGYCHALLDGLP